MKAGLIQLLFPLFMYALGVGVVACAVYPGLYLLWIFWGWGEGQTMPLRLAWVALGLGAAFFAYGLTVIFVCGAFHRVLHLDLKPGRYEFTSLTALRWVFASSLYMLVKYTWADFLVCTPFFNWYFRMLGAKVGAGVMINSKFVHDHSLLEIGDGTIIGGDAVISCHAAEKNALVLTHIKIGKKCLIGQKSILMPGVEVGDGAVIGAQALVLKNTVIPPGTTWVGIPARQLES